MTAVGRLGWIQVDSLDPLRVAQFWSKMLDRPIGEVLGDPPHYVGLPAVDSADVVVSFHRVPERKTVKNRLHFDVVVDDVEAASARVVELGGRVHAESDFTEYGFSWRVVADPEDNEFCLVY